MKNILIILSFLTGFNAVAQESILDLIAQETCEYLQSDEVASLPRKQKTTKLGLFIIEQYNVHKKALKLEGVELDFADKNSPRAFGEKVGQNMVKFCAEALVTLASKEESSTETKSNQFFIGEIVSIDGSEFSFIQVKETSGISQKFLWLANFKGSERIISQNSDTIIGVQVKVIYKNTECFSPKLNEYIIRKEIVEIEFLD